MCLVPQQHRSSQGVTVLLVAGCVVKPMLLHDLQCASAVIRFSRFLCGRFVTDVNCMAPWMRKARGHLNIPMLVMAWGSPFITSTTCCRITGPMGKCEERRRADLRHLFTAFACHKRLSPMPTDEAREEPAAGLGGRGGAGDTFLFGVLPAPR